MSGSDDVLFAIVCYPCITSEILNEVFDKCNDAVFEHVLNSNLGIQIKLNACFHILEKSINAGLLERVLEDFGDCCEDCALYIAKRPDATEEMLIAVVGKMNEHQNRSARSTYSFFKPAKTNVSFAALLAMLKIIQIRYQQVANPVHLAKFAELITRVETNSSSSDSSDIISATWSLIRGGEIGSRFGNGRLRAALKELCGMAEKNQLLDVEKISFEGRINSPGMA